MTHVSIDELEYFSYNTTPMLTYNEITEKKYIDLDGIPYEVLSSHVFRKQQRKPVNQTKLRNVLSGKVLERTFHQSDKVQKADIDQRDIKYLYANRDGYMFCDPQNPKNRFTLPSEIIEIYVGLLKENTIISGIVFNDRIIGIKMPIKVDLIVKDTPPGHKGDTTQGGTKQATLETGAVVNVPLFINPGDVIRINTQTRQYTERVLKKQ